MKCTICKHELSSSGPYSDCGGDCMVCMASFDDPSAIEQLVKMAVRYHETLEWVETILRKGSTVATQISLANMVRKTLDS